MKTYAMSIEGAVIKYRKAEECCREKYNHGERRRALAELKNTGDINRDQSEMERLDGERTVALRQRYEIEHQALSALVDDLDGRALSDLEHWKLRALVALVTK